MEMDRKRKAYTDQERLELAAKLDAEMAKYIRNMKKRSCAEEWPENWQEEMEKHPFFMTKAPEPGDEISPLVEGLQQLKYGEDENTPEELANNYKEDGNYNYKHKNYHLAILSYTEGIRTKCKDNDLMAMLHNNRAAVHFILRNYRTCLNDCMATLRLKPDYLKALRRAIFCSYDMEDNDLCINLCDKFLECHPTNREILKCRSSAVIARECSLRDERKRKRTRKILDNEEEKLLGAILKRGVTLESTSADKQKLELSDLEPQIPQIAQSRVHFDEINKLVWPVMILYPEIQQTDFIQNFHEDSVLEDELTELFEDPPIWDIERRYTVKDINVYFEDGNKCSVHKVDIHLTLGKILQDKRFVIRGGTPAFSIFVRSSEAEKRFLANY